MEIDIQNMMYVLRDALALFSRAQEEISKGNSIAILGPSNAPLARLTTPILQRIKVCQNESGGESDEHSNG